ncbi:MAG: 3-deoxy-8-phosphooctulonate synthase [Candidatus Lightella neohaematopini]|nr:3-deoxy-8-phosphooctulonate synthase [Candidatus Lightella neohaematopini]MCV2529012.1 3-deoxy-8-phosphooctulonate synthase [Candidatus Lightella neohaematopini]
MRNIILKIKNIKISNNLPFVLFGGLNVLESRDIAMHVCEYYKNITDDLGIPYIFKASFDKANRTSIYSYRGLSLDHSINIFNELRNQFDVPIMTDVHEKYQVDIIKSVVDIIQLPAFLARQTDLIHAIAKTKKVVNVKKPQFISPHQVIHIVDKFRNFGNNNIIICERGTTFGYNNLVVDMLGFSIMKNISDGCPVIFDVTHSLQCRNNPYNSVSEGRSKQTNELARSGIAVGIAGLFIESHPNPDKAKCDGMSALPLKQLKNLLYQIKSIDDMIKSF